MRRIIVVLLFTAALVGAVQPPATAPGKCKEDKKNSYADDLSNLLIQVADPENTEFASFQKHFAKVIDTLDPRTEPVKVATRVDKLVLDMHKGVSSFHDRRNRRAPGKEGAKWGKGEAKGDAKA